jgi:hypothetical protein
VANVGTSGDGRARTRIAFVVVGVSIVGVLAVSAVALGFSDATGRPEMARLIFTAVLPLLGTWVGTVLAFYFARDNLQAATDSTINTLQAATRIAPTAPVTSVMTRFEMIDPKKIVADRPEADRTKLDELYQLMSAANRSRVPIFDASHVPLYVVHEPDIDKYAQIVLRASDSLTDDDTVQQLLEQGDPLKAAVQMFVTVPATATVADARSQLASRPGCKDIFVTTSGRDTDPVLGYLTNSDLARIQS